MIKPALFSRCSDELLLKLSFKLDSWRRRKDLDLIRNVIATRTGSSSGSFPTVVIGNAIPKSGTYLMNSIVRILGKWQNPRLHVMSHALVAMDEAGKSSSVYKSSAADIIQLMPGGLIVAAHLMYDEKLAALLSSSSRIKHIFFYRDFRDVFCSFNNWMIGHDEAGHSAVTGHKQRFYRSFFNSKEDSLAYTICSMMETEGFEQYIPWLHDPNTLSLRFEDVYRELLECPEIGFGTHLLKIFDFLSVDSTGLNPSEFARQTLEGGWTSSGRINKVGQFRSIFKDQHYRLICNQRFYKLMKAYGYSLDETHFS